MKYNKDKRTKNLTLREIHVGDWVQAWGEETERYSLPLKIMQICDDGTIYLIGSEDERPMPLEEDIKNIDTLRIDNKVLRGFGFVYAKNKSYKLAIDDNKDFIYSLSENYFYIKDKSAKSNSEKYYAFTINDLQYKSYRFLKYNLELEWKGVDK